MTETTECLSSSDDCVKVGEKLLKRRKNESPLSFEFRVMHEKNVIHEARTKWLHQYPVWFRSQVMNANKLRLVKGVLSGNDTLKSECLRILQCDDRFARILDHCGGENGTFVCEPYCNPEEAAGPAQALADVLGCVWRIVPGGQTWNESTIRIEFDCVRKLTRNDVEIDDDFNVCLAGGKSDGSDEQ